MSVIYKELMSIVHQNVKTVFGCLTPSFLPSVLPSMADTDSLFRFLPGASRSYRRALMSKSEAKQSTVLYNVCTVYTCQVACITAHTQERQVRQLWFEN